MNSDGVIRRGDERVLKQEGFHLPLSELEAMKLEGLPQEERVPALVGLRHDQLRVRRFKRRAKAVRFA
jgi:hypothetical protein